MNRTLMNMARSMMFFKNVKLMFWGDAVVCATYLRNRSPSHVIEHKTPHEMWFGHLPSVRRLRIFGSTCYALIPKEQSNKLGARSRRCIFSGYSDTSKEYGLYDEVNKKFVVSRGVIFLETNKNDKSIKRQLDRLERFSHLKTNSEFDNEIPNIEGGVLILDYDQSLEFNFQAPTPPS